MAISRRGGNKTRFAGIVAVGENRLAACNAYRAAVNNRDLTLCSESNVFTAIAGDSDGEYSPFTGIAMDVASDEIHDKLESNSSGDMKKVNVHLTVCSDGCNKVLVSDAALEPSFCPSCSCAIPELSNDEVLDELAHLESESDDDNFDSEGVMDVNGDQGIVVVASSFDEAQALFTETLADASQRVSMSDGDAQYVTHASCVEDFSPFTGEASEIDEDAEVDLEAIASEGEEDEVAANYLQCVASGCEAHILTTSDNTSFCPQCAGGLVDPEILNSISSDDVDEFDELEVDDDLESDSADDDFEDDLDGIEDDLDELEEDDIDLESDSSDEDFDDDELDDMEDLDDVLDSESSEEDDDDFDSESSEEDDDDFDSESGDDDDEDDIEDDLDSLDDDEDDLDDDIDDDDDDDEDDVDFDSESSVDVGEIELDLFEAYAGVDEEQHDPALVHVSHCGSVQGDNTWIAMYNGYPVARCLESQSSNKHFNSAHFGEAVAATVKSQGVRAGLLDMGFEFLKPDVDFGTAVSAKLVEQHQTELQEVRESISSEIDDVQDRFEAALSTSAMALNRGIMKGRRNPVADSLVSSLRAAGVGNAQELVATAFEQHSDTFVKSMVQLASEQVNKPLESQNDFAEMVASASFNATASANATGVDIGRSLSSVSSEAEQQKQETEKFSSESSEDTSDFATRLSSAFDTL